ncbi:hypothetical protein [Streptomyces sp. RerS4]|uniref:hypothetical protein n=1 Tax=Streptomyces sp. RerS4 TaxID=2942449 RepID=UPI00201C6A02|nr:hypothetical protein [Streptomyces sp. RerS4]UQX02373.1 hypothetical protein M4D82_19170 [Streptomyces sp. RerS4]
MHSYARDAHGSETLHNPLARVATIGEPSTNLLDRAHAGWERFLETFEGPSDE